MQIPRAAAVWEKEKGRTRAILRQSIGTDDLSLLGSRTVSVSDLHGLRLHATPGDLSGLA